MKDQNLKPSDRVREDEDAIVPTGKGEILLYQTGRQLSVGTLNSLRG